jgi:hypothetical protein
MIVTISSSSKEVTCNGECKGSSKEGYICAYKAMDKDRCLLPAPRFALDTKLHVWFCLEHRENRRRDT